MDRRPALRQSGLRSPYLLIAVAAVAEERPMRIAFLLPTLGGGGAERVALTLIQEFVSRGYQVDLVLAEAKGELLPLLPPAVRVFDLKARRMRYAFVPFIRYLRARKPDAVQARMWPLTIIAIAARAFARSSGRE